MSPEKTHQERLEPTPARRRAKGKTRWGSFDRKAAQIRSLFSKNPALATLTATGLGIATLGKTATAKADWSFVGGDETLDRVDLGTGALLSPPLIIGSSQAYIRDGKWIQPSSGGPYIILSVIDPGTYDKLVKMTDLDTATPTLDILPEPVSVPKQIDVNVAEGIFSVHSGGTGESLACQIDDTDVCERYFTGVTNSVGAIFDNLGSSNPTLIGVSDIDGTVNTYPLAPDADGDGFPEPSATGEIATDSEDLGGAAAGLRTFHFDYTTKVLTVGAYTGEMIHSMDIDTSSSTPSILTRYDTPFINLHPTGIIDTGTGELVVLGIGVTVSTGSRASFTTGLNASALTPAVPEGNFTGFGSRVPSFAPGGMTSTGELAVIHANWQEVRLYDLVFNQVGGPFSVNAASIDAMVVAQDPSVIDPDVDGDGVPASLDCDDTDASAWEESEFWVDADGDLFGDDTAPSDWFCGATEAAASGYTATVGGDCDDGDATIFPGATEVCDGVDQNCVDGADEGLPPSDWYDDSGDEDGFGDPATTTSGCAEPTAPGLWVLQGGDCAPANSSAYPGAPEPSCGGPDLNCDETSPPACSGDTDGDGDGFTPDEGDCNDSDPTINPGAPEVCGGADEDCDGQENEGDAQDAVLLWTDGDGDGRGLPGAAELGCEGTPGTATQDGDCNDGDASVYPGAPEYADGRDKDCDTYSSAAVGTEIGPTTDDTLIGNPGVPAANGPNYIKGLGQSINVMSTHMIREDDEISGETQEVLAYQIVNPASTGQLRVSREAGGAPIYVYQRPESAPEDYIPTWTAAVTGTVLEVLHQPSGISRLTVVEGTSVEFESNFYDVDLWEAYFEAHPEASDSLILSGPDQWAEVDEDTGEITATNVQEIQNFLNFAEKYQQGDDDSGDDDSGDDDTGDDDTQDDDDIGDDDTTPPEADDDETQGDDDSAGEGPDCEEGCNTFGKSPGKGHPIEAILIMLGLAGAAFRRRFRRSQSGSNLEAPAMIEELRGRVDLVARAANQNPGTATSSFRSAIARTMRGNRAIIKARRREQRNSA